MEMVSFCSTSKEKGWLYQWLALFMY
jgi:hypothetical protein